MLVTVEDFYNGNADNLPERQDGQFKERVIDDYINSRKENTPEYYKPKDQIHPCENYEGLENIHEDSKSEINENL